MHVFVTVGTNSKITTLWSDGKAVTVTVGGQQDEEEDTVTAVAVGQIPAAQQLF